MPSDLYYFMHLIFSYWIDYNWTNTYLFYRVFILLQNLCYQKNSFGNIQIIISGIIA